MKSYENIALLCNNYISYYYKLVPCSGKTKHGHAVVKVWMSFWDEVLVCGHRNIWSRVRTCHIINIVNVHWVNGLISLRQIFSDQHSSYIWEYNILLHFNVKCLFGKNGSKEMHWIIRILFGLT